MKFGNEQSARFFKVHPFILDYKNILIAQFVFIFNLADKN